MTRACSRLQALARPCRPQCAGSALAWLPLCLFALSWLGCRDYFVLHRQLTQPAASAALDHGSPYLKAHLRDGGVLVFDQWAVSDSLRLVTGRATRYNARRDLLGRGQQALPLDSVVLLETNTLEVYSGTAVLRVMAGIYLAGDMLCAAAPKLCFGSCPTFYTLDGPEPVLQAEGFSASVSPCLEASDLDALCRPHRLPAELVLEVRNEALETHAIRRADLILVPCRPGEEIFKDSAGAFWAGRESEGPLSGDGLDAHGVSNLAEKDGREWTEPADSLDLGVRRSLELAFWQPPSERLGLAICGRQSLLTTFVFYQALAWMGSRAGDCLAALERGDLRWTGTFNHLAEIRVSAWDGRAWREAGTLFEVGPLAQDEHLVLLPDLPASPDGQVRVRLEFTRGAWRLDRVALAAVAPAAPATHLPPSLVTRGGAPAPAALADLLDPQRLLTTEPGDAYRLHYRVPAGWADAAAFLDSRGWYLEWMREAWLREENPRQLARLLRRPGRALRELAPAFKAVEAEMDEIFWHSRYAR